MKKAIISSLIKELQIKIDSGILTKNEKGEYKTSKIFYDCNSRIYARGHNAEELANNLLKAKDKRLNREKTNILLDSRFDSVAVGWYDTMIKGRKLGERNIINHKVLINKHIIEEFGHCRIYDIKNQDLQNFLNAKGEQYSFSQVNKLKHCLEGIFTYAYVNRLIDFNPALSLKMPKCQSFNKESKNPVSKEELTLALKATKNDFQMMLILIMLYIYGLRTIELVNLKWNNINFEKDYIYVEKSKYTDAITTIDNESVSRYIPLSPLVKNLLLQLKETDDPDSENQYIFLTKNSRKPLNTTTLDKYFHTLNRTMEIANGATVFNNKIIEYTNVRHFTPYAFRHGVATRFDSMNYNDAISEQFIGHKPTSVKNKYYSELEFEMNLRGNYDSYMNEVETELQIILTDSLK